MEEAHKDERPEADADICVMGNHVEENSMNMTDDQIEAKINKMEQVGVLTVSTSW